MRRIDTYRSVAIGSAAVASALALNRALVTRETKPAAPEGGVIVQLPGGALHVVDEGADDAPVLLLLHGLAGSLRWFDRLVPLLAERHRVVRIDLLGHGGSEKPRRGYAISHQAEVVAAALERLDLRPVAVVGHAMGGAVAVALAERAPELVPRLAILDEGPDNSFGSFPLLARLGLAPVLGELLHRLVSDGMVRDGYDAAFAEGFDLAVGFDDPDQVVRDFRRMTFSSYKRSTEEEEAYLAARRLDHRASELGIPLLVAFGERDRFFRADESAAAFRALPDARVEIVSGCGHSPNVERPDQIAPMIEELASTGRSAR